MKRLVVAMWLAPVLASAQEVADPYSFRGVPMHATETRFLRTLPEFRCGRTLAVDTTRSDRTCWPISGDALLYGDRKASWIRAEFIDNALCAVVLGFSLRPGLTDEMVHALIRHLGSPKWALEHYADGREAVLGGHKDTRSHVVAHSWLWQGADSFVRMRESLQRGHLDIEYSTDACDEARERRHTAGATPGPPRRQM